MKKNIWFLLVLLLLSILSGCYKNKNILLLGDYNESLVQEMTDIFQKNINSYFTHDKMQSGELFKIVDSNASYLESGKKKSFFSVAEKTDLIMINIGLNDFLPSMNIDVQQNILEYDSDLIEKQLEIFEYHYYHIIENIKEINSNSHLYLLSSFNCYAFETPERKLFNTLVHKINDIILDLITSFDRIEFISLVGLEDLVYHEKQEVLNQYIAITVKEHIDE